MLESVDPAVVGLSKERLALITSWLEAQVTDGKLAGASTPIARRGKVAYLQCAGFADKEIGKVMDADTIVRIYSMSKSVTTVAAMMLYEQGCFQLDDPVAKYLPEFADTPVWDGGDAPITVQAQRSPMQIRHLMNHTSGLTYGFMNTTPVDAQYRDREIEFQSDPNRQQTLSRDWLKFPCCVSPARNGIIQSLPTCSADLSRFGRV